MTDTLKSTVIARDSVGRKLDDVSNRIAPNVSKATDREMMFCINDFLDDIIALGEQINIPQGKSRKMFKKTAIAFIAMRSTQIDELVNAYGQLLAKHGALNVHEPLRELAELGILETLLVRVAISHN